MITYKETENIDTIDELLNEYKFVNLWKMFFFYGPASIF